MARHGQAPVRQYAHEDGRPKQEADSKTPSRKARTCDLLRPDV